MVQIKPFKAIRPHAEKAKEVASLPYDVLNTEEARVLGDKNPESFLHIDKAEIDLAKEYSPYAEEVYLKAQENLQKFISQNWLVQDETNNLYIYQLTMNGRTQTGLVVCTSVDEYAEGKIKKHEYTRPEKEKDRIRHMDSTDANTSPIFLTYRGRQEINQLIEEWVNEHTPVYDFTSFYEVTHKVWVVSQETVIQQLVELFSSEVDTLYIADGHHRTESAVKVALKRKEEYPDALPNAEFNYFMSVLFPKEELTILDYNRVLDVEIPPDFLDQIAEKFDFREVREKPYKPEQPKSLGMYVQGTWYELKVKQDYILDNPVEALDVSILQQSILSPLFQVTDVRTDSRIDFVGGIRGVEALQEAVDTGKYTIAFSLYPPEMDQLLEVADMGEIMPPKSTWFEPKLLSGLFVHDLESK